MELLKRSRFGTASSSIWNGSDGSCANGRPNRAYFSTVPNGNGLV